MSKKDEALSQFESVLKELKKGEEEIAATAVASRSKGNTNVFGSSNSDDSWRHDVSLGQYI